MATKINKNELDAMVRNGAIATLGLTEVGTQIGTSTYAIPVETPEGTFYAKVAVTAAQRTATKVYPAFDLDVAVENYAAEVAEKEAKARERAEAKAAKLAKAKKTED